MQTENPTPSEGASIQERLESYLSTDEPQEQQEAEPTEVREEAAPVDEVEVETENDEGADDEPQLSLTDLAKYLKVDETVLDVDEAGELSIRTKVDGQEGKAKLTDLLTSYQLRSHLDNQTRAVAEQQKAIQAQAVEIEQQIQQRVQHVNDLTSAAQSQLNREFQNIDWQTLRVTDPAEYAATYQDFQARQAHINNIAASANQQRQQYTAIQQQQHDQLLRNEWQTIPTVIPEWSNDEVMQKDVQSMKQWAAQNGYQPGEIESAAYARHLATLRKAMLYDQLQTNKASVEHRVRSAPKLVKPGQAAPRNSAESTAKSLKAEIRKSGGKRGIAEYLIATGKV
jgi:hypothetical protein